MSNPKMRKYFIEMQGKRYMLSINRETIPLKMMRQADLIVSLDGKAVIKDRQNRYDFEFSNIDRAILLNAEPIDRKWLWDNGFEYGVG